LSLFRYRNNDNNKAWRTAEAVRRDWLTQLLARKTAPKGAMRFVIAELADPGTHLAYTMQRHHEVACQLLGVEQAPPAWDTESDIEVHLRTVLDSASDARAEVIALGLALGAYEETMVVDIWRRPPAPRQAAYLSKLVEWGYGPMPWRRRVSWVGVGGPLFGDGV
jgi:ParB family chromosome partitioning protein